MATVYYRDPSGYIKQGNTDDGSLPLQVQQLYSQYQKSQVEPKQAESALTGSQLSNITKSTELPKVQSEAVATTYKLPELTGNEKNDRKIWQNTYNQAGSDLNLKDALAKGWANAHKDNALFSPTSQPVLNDKQMTDLKTSTDAVALIDQALSTLPKLKNSQDKWLGGPQGAIASRLADSPLQFLLNTNERNYLGALLRLQGAGDRSLMGGRLIRDLVNRFSPAFPSGATPLDQTQDMLLKTRNQIIKDIESSADNLGLDYTDLPGVPSHKPPLEIFYK